MLKSVWMWCTCQLYGSVHYAFSCFFLFFFPSPPCKCLFIVRTDKWHELKLDFSDKTLSLSVFPNLPQTIKTTGGMYQLVMGRLLHSAVLWLFPRPINMIFYSSIKQVIGRSPIVSALLIYRHIISIQWVFHLLFSTLMAKNWCDFNSLVCLCY